MTKVDGGKIDGRIFKMSRLINDCFIKTEGIISVYNRCSYEDINNFCFHFQVTFFDLLSRILDVSK